MRLPLGMVMEVGTAVVGIVGGEVPVGDGVTTPTMLTAPAPTTLDAIEQFASGRPMAGAGAEFGSAADGAAPAR